jgi:hypothetical protein
MTTATVFPARRPGALAMIRAASLALTGRLMRLEARRNAMLLMLPPVIVLFWFDGYRTAVTLPPFWALRSMTVELYGVLDFAPLAAAAAAWIGTRDRRRRVTELVATVAWPRWTARLASWAATTALAIAVYLICVAAVYTATARQASWGGPLWWPVAVGVGTVAAACAVGFAAGALLPSRFTAPTVAIVVFALFFATLHPLGASPYSLLSPANGSLGVNLFADIGVFYPYLPDLAIVQLMFMAGLTAVALGPLGLPRDRDRDGRRLRWLAAVVTVAGLAATGTAIGLVGTARLDSHDMVVIPAVHDAASDQPLAYTPACSQGAIPVCVHPAFRAYLPSLTAALAPALAAVAGLPGAPVRVTQQATTFYLNSAGFQTPRIDAVSSGNPPAIGLPLGIDAGSAGNPSQVSSALGQAAPAIMASVVGSGGQLKTPAQMAVAAGLLKAAGVPLLTPAETAAGTGPGNGALALPPGSAIYRAALRFAALPAAVRHAWLLRHLPALRTGHLTLTQLP